MANNDNSVNIEKKKRGYHHGDLRAALVQAGLEQLKTRAVDDVSLREIARAAGVSATAVYRHFPDKQALLWALCDEGQEELARLQQAAMEQGGGGKAGFDEVGRVYVRFALANPALFRLIMSTSRGRDLTTDPSGSAAMQLLLDGIGRMLPPEASEEQKRIAAIQAWAIVHGLAMLMLDGQIPPVPQLIDQVIDSRAITTM